MTPNARKVYTMFVQHLSAAEKKAVYQAIMPFVRDAYKEVSRETAAQFAAGAPAPGLILTPPLACGALPAAGLSVPLPDGPAPGCGAASGLAGAALAAVLAGRYPAPAPARYICEWPCVFVADLDDDAVELCGH